MYPFRSRACTYKITETETENFTFYYLYLRGRVTVVEYCMSGSVWICTWCLRNCSQIALVVKVLNSERAQVLLLLRLILKSIGESERFERVKGQGRDSCAPSVVAL
jgi:hypothetical protein